MKNAIAVLLLAAAFGLAQTSTSELSGTVRDNTGAVVPGAGVTLTNEQTGLIYKQRTTDSGLYSFPALPVGSYTVTVEVQGFKTARLTKNTLVVNTPLAVDVTLEVGQIIDVVMVEARGDLLQTSNATIGNVVTSKEVTELPLNGRNPLTLLVLEPGVVQRSAGGAGSGIHVNGSRDRAYNVTIDGIEANESTVPNPVSNLYRINPDNVQEFKVTTNNATAEEGRNSGASISIASRSGTSELHGTGFFFLRNDALNSNEWFANAQKTAKPQIRMGQYGGEMGGPIKKNKTFFFGSYQQNHIDFTQPIDQTFGIPIVYNALARAGTFRYFFPDPTCNASAGTGNCFRIGNTIITRNNTLLVNPATGAYATGVHDCVGAETNCIRTYITSANNTASRPLDSVIG